MQIENDHGTIIPLQNLVITPPLAGYLFTPQKQRDILSANFENNQMSSFKAQQEKGRKKGVHIQYQRERNPQKMKP